MTAALPLLEPQTLNIREMVREIMRDTELLGPAEITREVISRIPDDKIHDALALTLSSYVRTCMHQTLPATPASTPFRPSRKVQGIRSWWEEKLRDQVHTQHGWKHLSSCTRDDLLFAVAERVKIAEATMAKAQQFKALADLVAQHDVNTVAELPSEVLLPALEDWR